MFNNLKKMLGQQPTIDAEQGEMYQDSFDNQSNFEDLETLPVEESYAGGRSEEEILNDPNSPYELKKQAMQMIKDRYLKPRE